MSAFIDMSFLTNPVGEYIQWLKCKSKYQLSYWGKHLRIGYLSIISNCSFGNYNIIGTHCLVANTTLGDFSYINSHSYVLWATIGKYCSIGPNVKIAPGKHPSTVFVSTHPATFNNQSNFVKSFTKEPKFKNYQQVTIGNDIWIGANSIIIDGVTIADGAIIAANSVVVKDVGAYEIVGGNPAKFIKKRFSEDQIKYLGDFEWWNKDEAWLEDNISKFWNIEEFTEQ
jgi:acetyltransferase-like isoleucine patch superfamily enzyme